MADRRVSVKIDADVNPYIAGLATASAATKTFASHLNTADSRMSNIVQASLALGPALVPIAAVGVPAIAGLATQLGFAAGAAGVAALAFSGVGDGLKAVNDYAVEPTTANFEKMQQAMAELGPAGRDFVTFLQELRPELQGVQDIAQEGMLPGVQEGIESLMTLMPQVEDVVSTIAATLGDLASEAGANLAGPQWREFFDYLESEARPILLDFGRTLGNFIEGVANMVMRLDPLSQSFSDSMLRWSRDFAAWSDQLSESEGFASFVDYIQSVGPAVGEALGALGNAFLELVKAAAPVGQALLPLIEALANGLALIASSPAGPVLIGVVSGLNAVALSLTLLKAANITGFVSGLRGINSEGKKASAAMTGISRAGAGLVAAAIGMAAIASAAKQFDEVYPGVERLTGALFDLTNGLSVDLRQFSDIKDSISDLMDPGLGDALGFLGLPQAKGLREATTQVEALDAAFANLVSRAGPDAAADALAQFARQQNLSAEETRNLTGLMPQYQEALAGVANGAEGAAAANRGLSDAERDAADAARQLRADLQNLSDALEGRASMRGFEAAIDAVSKSLKENGKTLDINTAKGRANQETLDGIASAALGVAEGMRGANKVRFLNRARADFVDAADKMGKTAKGAERLADKLGLVERKDPRVDFQEKGGDKVAAKAQDILEKLFNVDDTNPTPTLGVNDQATPTLGKVQGLLNSLDGDVANTYVVTHYRDSFDRPTSASRPNLSGVGADGGTVPRTSLPYADRHPYLLADGEEVVSNRFGQADKHRDLLKDINAGRLAGGGTAGRPVDNRLDLLNLEQQIRQLKRELHKGGKESLKGLARQIAEAELEIARRDLRTTRHEPIREARTALWDSIRAERSALRDKASGIREARGGFEVDRDMSTADVRAELAEFRKAIRESGGTWNKRLQRMGDNLVKNAQKLNASERAVERETNRRERLNDKLDESVRSLDSLRSAMDSFSSSVAGNFLSDPFNQASAASGSSAGGGGGAGGPSAASRALRDQLAAVRADATLDPLERSYRASKLLADIDALGEDASEAMGGLGGSAVAMSEQTDLAVSGLEAFRASLERDIETATAFGEALDTLIGKGLDTTGRFGGLYAGLATSGDLGTATELAALSASQIDEYEKMFATRDEVAATIAARATQAVYGEQQAILQKQINGQNKLIAASTKTLDRLDNKVATLGNRVENGAERGVRSLAGELKDIRAAIANVANQQRDNKRAGKGRG